MRVLCLWFVPRLTLKIGSERVWPKDPLSGGGFLFHLSHMSYKQRQDRCEMCKKWAAQ